MSRQSKQAVGVFSKGIRRIPFLSVLLGTGVRLAARASPSELRSIAGWGRRPTSAKAIRYAAQTGLPYLALEDGFLRSYGTGADFPPLSLVQDEQGIYYDSTRASTLENLLNSPVDVLAGQAAEVARARQLVVQQHRLSKYNHAPLFAPSALAARSGRRVLVVDQTVGDMSVALGAADATSFAAMLAAARAENPQAVLYIKTHPEVSAGIKRGYLTSVASSADTIVLSQAVNPLSLIEHMDHVYVVTSGIGFEALLAGKPVTVFGKPWYAGWGLSDDRQPLQRRTRARSVDELFAAAFFHYTRYLNPENRQPGSIFDVIGWLVRQRSMADKYAGRMICVGLRRWKAANLKPLLSLDQQRVVFVPNARAAAALRPRASDCLLYWGCAAPAGLAALASAAAVRLVRLEDGFVRSVGLGSDLIRPLSLVLDDCGIYFDPTQESGLERILAQAEFSREEIETAQRVRAFIVEHGITKYNLEPRAKAAWPVAARQVVLVPGQVEDDASIRYGCTGVNTNLGLLQAARQAEPDAFIVYKPHPDVQSGNRAGDLDLGDVMQFADLVESHLSVVSCIDACDVVHTMTSLTGFDALLRGKRVVVYGMPFYAGWGLTEDVLKHGAALARRTRRLTLDQLVVGCLLRYPLYWDWELKGYTSCEAVLQRLLETRNALEARGGLEKLRVGLWRRQWRKLGILSRAWTTRR